METLVAAHERLWHIKHPGDLIQRELADQPSKSEKKLTSIDWLFRRVHDLVMKQPRDVLEHSILTP